VVGVEEFTSPAMRSLLDFLETQGSWHFASEDPAGLFAAAGWEAEVAPTERSY
jgi:hypothetical protein